MIMRAIRIAFWLLSLLPTLILRGDPAQDVPQAVTLTVSNPACVQSSIQQGACYINFNYIYATSTDPNFTSIEVTIAGKNRLRMTTFFENSTYLTGSMIGRGLLVTCGRPNASGVPNFGRIYPVSISARVTGGSPITDIANVTCPAYESTNYLPLINK
jgi:hypothetical protein